MRYQVNNQSRVTYVLHINVYRQFTNQSRKLKMTILAMHNLHVKSLYITTHTNIHHRPNCLIVNPELRSVSQVCPRKLAAASNTFQMHSAYGGNRFAKLCAWPFDDRETRTSSTQSRSASQVSSPYLWNRSNGRYIPHSKS